MKMKATIQSEFLIDSETKKHDHGKGHRTAMNLSNKKKKNLESGQAIEEGYDEAQRQGQANHALFELM
jgi:hypothetical protein